jgi:peroxiredoxin
MKTLLLFTLSSLFTLSLGTGGQIAIGDKAPGADIVLTDAKGASTDLSKLSQENGICIIFSCNTCPYVIGWEDRYNGLFDLCAKNGIGFALINSNEAKRDGDDSPEAMLAHAKEKGYASFAYLIDKDHKLADAFGATKTPDVFLFNSKMELVYKGAIDDNMKEPKAVTQPYLANAINNMLSGKAIDPAETKAIGCTIKRK